MSIAFGLYLNHVGFKRNKLSPSFVDVQVLYLNHVGFKLLAVVKKYERLSSCIWTMWDLNYNTLIPTFTTSNVVSEPCGI